MRELILLLLLLSLTWKVWVAVFSLIYEGIRQMPHTKPTQHGPDMHEPWQDSFGGMGE